MHQWNRIRTRGLALALLALVIALLSGCDQLTGSMEVGDLETEVFQLQATIDTMGNPATVQALQLLATQSIAMQSELDVWRAQATATAQAGGVVVVPGALNQGLPQTTPQPAAPAQNDGGGGGLPAMSPTPPPQVTAASSTQTTFSDTITSMDINSADSCPLDRTTQFAPTEDIIYITSVIRNLTAGSTLRARWVSNGEDYYDEINCWTPDSDWAEVCAWCAVVPGASGVFPEGTWTVELYLDEQLRASARFQVGDAMSAGEGSGAATQ